MYDLILHPCFTNPVLLQHSDNSRVLYGDNTTAGREIKGESKPRVGRQDKSITGTRYVP